MGSNTGVSPEGSFIYSSSRATKGNVSKESLNIVENDKNYSNEQGHLWMCAACDDHPTFETIFDLFQHKRCHVDQSFQEININHQNNTDRHEKRSRVIKTNTVSSDLKLKLQENHETKSYSENTCESSSHENLKLNKRNEGEIDFLNSPSLSPSSDDIPLARLFSINVKSQNVKVLANTKGSKLRYSRQKNKTSPGKRKNVKELKLKKENKEKLNVKSAVNKCQAVIDKGDILNIKKDDDENYVDIGCGDHDTATTITKEAKKKLIEESSYSDMKDKKKNMCKICNMEFINRFDLSVHKKTHLFGDTGNYKCETCGKMCLKYDNFTRHLTIHFANRVKTHQCTQCFASFYNLADLKRHLVLHMAVKPFKCEHCGEGFVRQDSLFIHAYKHTGVQYRKFACKDCDKVLNSPSALVMHVKTHSVKTVFCPEPECKFSCYLQSQLRQHLRKHSGEKPFQCAQCGRCFARSNDMKNHALNVHEGIRPFKCSACPKKFALIGNLKIHKITHTNERPYLCAQCGKCFNQSSTLRKHSIIMHNPWRTTNKQSKTKRLVNSKLNSSSDAQTESKLNEIRVNLCQEQLNKKTNEEYQSNTDVTIETSIQDSQISEKVFYLNTDSSKEGDPYETQNVNSICGISTPATTENPSDTHLQMSQITVTVPIPIEPTSMFILPTVIIKPDMVNTDT
ncbi:hypothetical protein RUM44_003330 [Polyplax serrata]|uniref:C2H2-type domain-containing protein n=1 Tax=Polyplax serrata TaxID=468196 RepID=A0ABR1AGA0_POLSC